jgi:hypothetical protein
VVEPGPTELGGLVLSWLLLAVLGMIWAAFLFPPRRRSPTSSVEEFERKMSLLAETNKDSPGRWVLMPRRGQRFLGPQDRSRARARRRRRQLFTVLLEACALTLLIGLFPPLRKMLYGTVILVAILLTYVVALIRIRAIEIQQARARRLAALRYAAHARAEASVARPSGHGSTNGAVHTNGHTNGNGNGNGHRTLADELRQGGVRIVDDDVHLVIRTSEELEREAILAGAARGSGGSLAQ